MCPNNDQHWLFHHQHLKVPKLPCVLSVTFPGFVMNLLYGGTGTLPRYGFCLTVDSCSLQQICTEWMPFGQEKLITDGTSLFILSVW